MEFPPPIFLDKVIHATEVGPYPRKELLARGAGKLDSVKPRCVRRFPGIVHAREVVDQVESQESLQAIDEGSRGIRSANNALSVILGHLAVWCGSLLVRR